ncbi:MAG: CBS domain-containing protein [Paracoccaceae bacterium]|nr:CBS domain-containing protein [Paracoccaceae bacterium]
MLVSQILNGKGAEGIVTIAPSATITEAVELLSSKKIGALVVSRDGSAPVGILSERDIVRELGRRGPACLGETVEKMMTKDVINCSREDTADRILAQMTEGRFRHLPVVENGKMVGLISIGDVVKARLSELSMEKDALEGMIMGY